MKRSDKEVLDTLAMNGVKLELNPAPKPDERRIGVLIDCEEPTKCKDNGRCFMFDVVDVLNNRYGESTVQVFFSCSEICDYLSCTKNTALRAIVYDGFMYPEWVFEGIEDTACEKTLQRLEEVIRIPAFPGEVGPDFTHFHNQQPIIVEGGQSWPDPVEILGPPPANHWPKASADIR